MFLITYVVKNNIVCDLNFENFFAEDAEGKKEHRMSKRLEEERSPKNFAVEDSDNSNSNSNKSRKTTSNYRLRKSIHSSNDNIKGTGHTALIGDLMTKNITGHEITKSYSFLELL